MNRQLRSGLRSLLRQRRRAGLLIAAGALLSLELLGRLGAGLTDGELVEPPDFPDDPGVVVVEAAGPGQRHLTELAAEAMHQRTWAASADADTFRVVALGDSTVYGPFPETLAAGLRPPPGAPEQRFEVLNFGMVGAISLNVRLLVDVALAQEPDLILVYVGHNETLGLREGPINRQPLWLRAATSALIHSGIGWLVRLPLALLEDGEEDREEHFEDACEDGACGPLTDAEWAEVSAIYTRNLRETCEEAGDAGVPVLMIMPVSSMYDDVDLQVAEMLVEPVVGQIRAGLQQLASGDVEGAESTAAALEARLGAIAELDVLRGAIALARGDVDAGRSLLRAARRAERVPDRAHDRHAEALREVAEGCGARFLGAEAFEADPRAWTLEDPLFVDQVHPSFAGNLKLAELVVEALEGALPAGSTYDAAAVDPEGLQPTWKGGWRPRQ